MKRLLSTITLGVAAVLTGCASHPEQKPAYDYSAFRAAKPRSILVLPPLNHSNDVKGTNGMLAQSTRPLAEAGYYVLPVALTTETFRQNGMTVPEDIHAIAPRKLRDIFGADAVLKIEVTQYGSRYIVVDSITEVKAKAKLVSLVTGQQLWDGTVQVSDAAPANSQQGLLSALVGAAIKQISSTVKDDGFAMASNASHALLATHDNGGLLYGPYHPRYQSEITPAATPASAAASATTSKKAK